MGDGNPGFLHPGSSSLPSRQWSTKLKSLLATGKILRHSVYLKQRSWCQGHCSVVLSSLSSFPFKAKEHTEIRRMSILPFLFTDLLEEALINTERARGCVKLEPGLHSQCEFQGLAAPSPAPPFPHWNKRPQTSFCAQVRGGPAPLGLELKS